MRVYLLASSLLFTPTIAFCAPSCAIPQDAADTMSPAFNAAVRPDTATSAAESPAMIGPDKVGRVPALRRIASNGAQLFDLGVQHGMQAVFARNGNTFQIFYLTPDGQGVVGGVMWDATGHNITRSQVAGIDGTMPSVGTVAKCACVNAKMSLAIRSRIGHSSVKAKGECAATTTMSASASIRMSG